MTFVLRRAGQAAIVLIAAFTATFFLLQLLPGDAILIKFSDPSLGLSPEQLDDIRATYGADVPWGAVSARGARLPRRRLRLLDPVRHPGPDDAR